MAAMLEQTDCADGIVRELVCPMPFDFEGTLQFHRFTVFDPTAWLTATEFAKAVHTPEGPATLYLKYDSARSQVRAQAWGPGATRLIAAVEEILGFGDQPEQFQPGGAKLCRFLEERHGSKLTHVPWLSQVHYEMILQQRVAYTEAKQSHRRLAWRMNCPAPGPLGQKHPKPLLLPISPSALRTLARAEYHKAGVDSRRASAIRVAMEFAGFLSVHWRDHRKCRTLLEHIPGTGVWTREMVMGFGAGDPDAVPLGDLHLPHTIAWALAGELRGSDERMIELLEPYRGHRFRIVRLMFSENFHAPRMAPRLARNVPGSYGRANDHQEYKAERNWSRRLHIG